MPTFECINSEENNPVDQKNVDQGDTPLQVIRDKYSEANMVWQMAAECIQEAYRRYKACKPDVKLKRIISCEKLVMNLAADTIKRYALTHMTSVASVLVFLLLVELLQSRDLDRRSAHKMETAKMTGVL